MQLAGKVALVTGAGSGIGRAAAHAFAREGARVAVVELLAERAQTVADEINETGGNALPVVNFCLNNVTTDERRWLHALDLGVVEDYCLQRCGDCFAGPFLVVDGKLVSDVSHAQLLNKLSVQRFCG